MPSAMLLPGRLLLQADALHPMPSAVLLSERLLPQTDALPLLAAATGQVQLRVVLQRRRFAIVALASGKLAVGVDLPDYFSLGGCPAERAAFFRAHSNFAPR